MANKKTVSDNSWLDTKTSKRIDQYLLDMCLPYKEDDDPHTIADYTRPITALVKILVALERPDMDEGPTIAETAIPRVLESLQQIAKQHPAAERQATDIAKDLFRSFLSLKSILVPPKIQRERKTIRPLVRWNSTKITAVERAKTIADDIWKNDTAQEIRIGEAAKRIYQTLVDEGFTKILPDSFERIKKWIKPVAPDYACKGGRRRKTP